ncbi:MAG: DUF2784 domain-containing protein [Gemmatimonadota bacterium]
MPYALLADLVLAGHLAFVLFVVLGGLLVVRWPRATWLHLPVAAWGVWIELSGGVCPLTPLENRLRRAAGGAGYEETFIEHYIVPLIYPPGLTHATQLLLGVALIVWSVGVYAWAIHRWRQRRMSKPHTSEVYVDE